MHIAWLEMGTREYDLEYLRLLELYLEESHINDKWAKKPLYDGNYSRRISREEKTSINIEIARIKNKWRITAAA